MKTIKHFLLTLAVLLCSISASAYDFEVDGIYYSITSEEDLTVKVDVKSSPYLPEYDEYVYTGSVTIPESVTYNNTKYSVTSIGKFAFYSCPGLTSVTIPNSVTSIGQQAFIDCTGLTSVTIPNSVTMIDFNVFYGCTGLTSVTIPNSVTDIRNGAFEGCYKLQKVINYSNLDITKGSKTHGHVGYYANWIFNGEGVNGYYFEERDDKYYLIGYAGNETSLSLPETYNGNNYSINNQAFYYCDNLTSITIPNSVTSIGDEAFCGCSDLTSVAIGDGVKSIGISAFYSSGLTTIEIPNNVTSINIGAFSCCESLTSVVIGDGVKSIWDEAFFGCLSLTDITMGNSVENIESSAFQNCPNLTSVVIPNSVTNIGAAAFSCSGLTSVTIGNSVKSIGGEAFFYCPNLTDVYCLAASVPETHYEAFENTDIGNATLHVPAESIEAYAAAEPWSGFGAIVALPAEEVEITIGTTGATTFCSEYALDFTDAEGVKAYAATGYNTETGVVTLTRVKTAKARTGLFVVGDEGTYSIPTIESSADNSLNMLVGTTEEVTIPTADGTYTNYIYGKSDDTTGFFKLTGDKVIPAGKAYLRIPTEWFPAVAESKIKIEFEDGTTTGIDDVEEQVRPNDGVIYDLHGRVVKNPGKGIYIVNGKKVLF